MKTVSFGIIGTNWITDKFIEGTRIAGGFSLNAVFSRSEETGRAFAGKYGVKNVFTSLEEMAAFDGIDAVYIASPNSFHYQYSKLFLQAGKHVICEKPAAVTSDEIRQLQEIALEKGLVYIEAIIMMHVPQYGIVRQQLPRLGKITTARIDYCQFTSKYQAVQRGETPNVFNPVFATGTLMDIGVYCVYPAVAFFGMPERMITHAGFLPNGSDIFGSSIFCYPDKQVVLTYSKFSEGRIGSEIGGDQGNLEIGAIGRLANISFVDMQGNRTKLYGDPSKEELMSGEARDFYRYITDPEGTAEEYRECRELSLKVALLMEQMRRDAGIVFESGK